MNGCNSLLYLCKFLHNFTYWPRKFLCDGGGGGFWMQTCQYAQPYKYNRLILITQIKIKGRRKKKENLIAADMSINGGTVGHSILTCGVLPV